LLTVAERLAFRMADSGVGQARGAYQAPSTPRMVRRVNVDRVSNSRQPAPEPLEANDQLVTAVITVGWAIALIVLLAVRTDIPVHDRWWIWTCAAGLGLGIFALLYVPRLKRSRERAARRRAEAGPR
jgi:Protein of unknown function (DUF2530)